MGKAPRQQRPDAHRPNTSIEFGSEIGKAPRQQTRQNVRRSNTSIRCGSCDGRIYTLFGVDVFPFLAPFRIKFDSCCNLGTKTNGDLVCFNCQRKLGKKIKCGSVYAELYDVNVITEDSDDDDDD